MVLKGRRWGREGGEEYGGGAVTVTRHACVTARLSAMSTSVSRCRQGLPGRGGAMSTDTSDGGGWALCEGFEDEFSREEATRVAGTGAGEGGAAAAAEARTIVRAGPLLGVEEGDNCGGGSSGGGDLGSRGGCFNANACAGS